MSGGGGTPTQQVAEALRREAEVIATGNDVERIPGAVDLLVFLLDWVEGSTEQ